MEKDWIPIFRTTQNFKAELAKGLLEENDIEFVLLNKKDSSYPDLFIGYIEIFIKRDDAIKAKYLLKELEK
ncbi:MAG: DUF2007 domain-containing protein [Bacteroidales bacterium]|nr:DUF2007 domain-containing protein [Bacteroidales bacterium]